MRDLYLGGAGPRESGPFPPHGDYDLVRVLAPGHQPPVALTESELRFPTDILNGLGQFFQPQLQVGAELGRVAVGPGPFDERPAGVRGAALGKGPLAAPPQRRILRPNDGAI